MPPTPGTRTESASDGDDLSLVCAVAAGDRKALERLYDRHAPLLLGVAVSVLRGGRAEAEDLLHDLFVEIWQHAGDYDPKRGSVRTWMTLRMRSRALDRLKSPSRARTTSLDAAAGDVPRWEPVDAGHGESPDQAVDHGRVRHALASLPSEQREVIELQYFAGCSGSEVAERLRVPLGTVKSRTAAALRKLSGLLGPTPDAGAAAAAGAGERSLA